MTEIVQSWSRRVTIGGTETDILAATIDHGVRRVGTCDLTIPLPLPSQVAIGAAVTVEASLDGAWLASPLFTGTVRQIDDAVTAGGATARVSCEGPLHRMTYPIGRLAFAGGAKAAAQTVTSSPSHVGTQTIAWYADTTGNGVEVEFTVTPSTDSDFVWIAGKIHGSNSYDTSIGDLAIKYWSHVDVDQAGDRLGYANLPVAAEDWADQLDYTDPGNWDDFEVFVAAPIVAADGDVTIRFHSGRKPGSSDYDEYEIDDVTWQTAGKQSIRQMVRGLLKRSGLTTAQYDVAEITDLAGATITLGGNGLVDAGQVILDRRDQPLAFVTRILDLFGFALFDCPDGVVRVRPFRGTPTGSAVATFAEGVSLLGTPTATIDPRAVSNAVRIEGASGNDAAGARFAYVYRTASPAASDYIPDPPGENLLIVSNSLLVSDALCQQAGEIQEASNGEARTVNLETWPIVLQPAQTVQVTAPTAGFTGKALVEDVRVDIDAGGYRMAVTAWTGSGDAVTPATDPNPSESDTEPGDPRPDDEWVPYNPLAAVQ